MSTWYDAFGAEYNASNFNYTDQSQSNPTVVSGGHVGPVDVANNQSNATFQDADAGFGGRFSPFAGGHAENFNATHQDQSNPTAVFGEHIGAVDVHNNQSNATYQQADAGSGGFHLPGFGPEAINVNVTTQTQANPTVIVGDHIGPVDVENNQSNATLQQADAGGSGGFFGFGSDASNFNATSQVQNDPTIIFADHVGPIHVDNNQSNVTEQFAVADHHFIA